MGLAVVELKGVTKRFETTDHTALQDLTLEVPQGMFVSVVGPSGCGKSTLLNLAAGLDQPSKGNVAVSGRVGYLFQQDALLPWKTVIENVLLGLVFRGSVVDRSLGMTWLRRVGLETFAAHFPSQLSGGMRRRVAMVQQCIVEPEILLMDEPFGALDVHTRHKMESELLGLWTPPQTILFVTHDLEEAIALSDRVVVLSAGPASTVLSSYDIDLPRPRNLIDIRTEDRFQDLYRRIWSDLRAEVLKSYAQIQ